MLELNEKERKRKEIIDSVINKKITQKEAALKLEITDRQIRRLIIKYYDQGDNAFIHGNKGKSSNKKISDDLSTEIINDYLNNYSDYNFSHFYEEQGFKYGISFATMINIFETNEIISPLAQHKTVKLYNQSIKNAIKDSTITEPQQKLYIQRKQEEFEKHIRKSTLHYFFGQEIQMDAAFWVWFGKDETALHLAVDKATKKVLYGWFDYEETVTALQFITILLRHLLPNNFKIIRYFGFYRKKHALHDKMFMMVSSENKKIRNQFFKYTLSIQKFFNYDPFDCPKCGKNMIKICYISGG